jgi:hypothetical protein
MGQGIKTRHQPKVTGKRTLFLAGEDSEGQ